MVRQFIIPIATRQEGRANEVAADDAARRSSSCSVRPALASAAGLTQGDVRDLIDHVCSVAVPQQIFFLWRPLLKDPNDDMAAELAVAAGCDAVITHNVRDFAGIDKFNLALLTPAAFLQQLRGVK
jgi:hypothetical protein